MKFLVTGGAGFIGSALVKYLIDNIKSEVMVLDKLSYAGSLKNLNAVIKNNNFIFKKVDVCNFDDVFECIKFFKPNKIMHLAAESHVDRSINSPEIFIKSNIQGTFVILEASLKYWKSLPSADKKNFMFHNISTDEVYGDLLSNEAPFTETSRYKPNSPYSASKASADHLVRAWNRTFGLPSIISNCSNNYGPYQNSEKLIPLIIRNALNGKILPIYGDGSQIRDWMHVDDHVKALFELVLNGKSGQSYNIGANNELSNLIIVRKICGILDEIIDEKPKNINSFNELISFVKDRPGHDQRYSIDNSKFLNDFNWKPEIDFDDGLAQTIEWYIKNPNF